MVDGLILINTFETSAKNKHTTNDKRLALSIVEQNNPFNMVSIKGKVIDQTTEGADEHLKRLAKRYLGIGKYYYRKPSHKRIIIKIQPEKIMGLSIHPAFISLHILRGIGEAYSDLEWIIYLPVFRHLASLLSVARRPKCCTLASRSSSVLETSLPGIFVAPRYEDCYIKHSCLTDGDICMYNRPLCCCF